jgi:predicted  nucleic acid-binding Zn-ribbon protein
MLPEWMEKLMILQDRDVRCDAIEKELVLVPEDLAKDEKEILAWKERLSQKEEELKQVEVQREAKEGDIAEAEEKIRRYKIQQMEVKKNEEYAAFNHQIAEQEERISQIEDETLELMERIEMMEQELAAFREEVANQIHTLEVHMQRLRDSEERSRSLLSEVRAKVEEATLQVDEPFLREYRATKSQVSRPPYIVELSNSRCGGCHLKVSGETESFVRKGTELVFCDNCSRILYFQR